jgi:hypothetical protein
MLGSPMSRLTVEAVPEQLAESDAAFAEAGSNDNEIGAGVNLDHVSASIRLFNEGGRYGARDLGSADPSGGDRNPGATRHPD